MQRNIVLRSQIIASIRRRMIEQGFTEFQTPILTASSPEGARDFLVPSRLHPGKFYALPQAPQQYKQLYMISGFDRYFQIAPCFRDEDARADRSPGEFYQLDIEMSFVTQEDVFAAVEPVMHGLFAEFSDWEVTPDAVPADHLSPTPCCATAPTSPTCATRSRSRTSPRRSAARASRSSPARSRRGRSCAPCRRPARSAGRAASSTRWWRSRRAWARRAWAGLRWATGEAKGPIAKFLDAERLAALRATCGAEATATQCSSSATRPDAAAKLAGQVRTRVGEELGLVAQNCYRFCWIVDFPMYEWDEEAKAVTFSHNPFSMPQGGMEALESRDPLTILAYQYDIVCNGIELSSGAIRNHRPDIMAKAFEIAGYGRKVLEERFGGMFRALHYGAPPHGGIAPGVDRIVMLLADTPNLREVTAFPLSQRAEELLLGAPGPVGDKQLKELHLQLSLAARERLRDEAKAKAGRAAEQRRRAG